jgi:hypothetical protein
MRWWFFLDIHLADAQKIYGRNNANINEATRYWASKTLCTGSLKNLPGYTKQSNLPSECQTALIRTQGGGLQIPAL